MAKKLTIIWAWESYQISSELYAAVENPGGNMIDGAYYGKQVDYHGRVEIVMDGPGEIEIPH